MSKISNSAEVFLALAGVAGESGHHARAPAVKATEHDPEAAFTQVSEARNAQLQMPLKWKRAQSKVVVSSKNKIMVCFSLILSFS